MGGNRYDKEREYSSGVGSSYRRSRQEEGGSAGEVGRDFASRYGGLFSEKDWKCPICSNINWARRPECNQCKTPKPGLETTMGSREGRGGGFMERDEIVEYRKSRDAEKDDEWDDFGRKRKRRENSYRGGKHSRNGSVNNDFKSEKSALKSNKSGEELEEDGDDDDRWAAWDDIIGNEDSKEENANYNKSKSTIYNERRSQRSNKLSHRRLSQSRSPYRRDRSLSRDRRSRKKVGKGLITEADHVQEVTTDIEVDLIQDRDLRI
ncbi:6070_t:CDS:2, partial [Rhizophagus irregularis]